MCLATSAPGMNTQETQRLDLKEETVKWRGTPLRSSHQRGESLSSTHSIRLLRKMSLIVLRGLQSVMGHSAMFSSSGLLLKVIIKWFLLIMKITQ